MVAHPIPFGVRGILGRSVAERPLVVDAINDVSFTAVERTREIITFPVFNTSI